MSIPMIAFRLANCTLVQEGAVMAMMIYAQSNGNPCRGCHYFERGSCPSYQRLQRVPPNFDTLVMTSVTQHIGLFTLTLGLEADHGPMPNGLGIILHMLTAKNPLDTPVSENIWNGLKQKFPSAEGGIDAERLAGAIKKKAKELGLGQ